MAFPLAAVIGGIGLAKSIFGKKDQPQQSAASPFMGKDAVDRYMALKAILKKVRSPYMASMMGRDGGSDGY